jgi:hypothetical protein
MDINSFNINKTNNHRTPQLIEYNNKTTPLPILYLCVDFQLHFNVSKPKNFELVSSFLINRFNIAIFLSMSQVGI